MKICFVEVPSSWLVRPNAQVPLGPIYLLTILKQAGHNVRFLRPKEIKDMDILSDHDVVAFSGTTLQYPMVETFARYMKDKFPKIKIWLGGPHVTVLYNEICHYIPKGIFDAIGFGEAESYILNMVRHTEEGCLQQFYFPEKPIEDLDMIPIPDRSLIEGCHGGAIFSYNKEYYEGGHENILTSRGCCWDCAFCASKSMWGRGIRYRSSENLIKELHQIIESGCRQFRFADDNLTAKKSRLREVCEQMFSLDTAWRCSARAEDLTDPEVCEMMVKAGCKEISVGIESGDERVLTFLNKKTDLDKMAKGVEVATKAGIDVRGLFMIGTPGELEDTPEINYEYIKKLPFKSISLTTFVPLPGCDVWKDPERFDSEILSRNFEDYNMVFFINENGKKVQRKDKLLIRNLKLSKKQQLDNIKRMKTYFIESEKFNRG